jgi:hypothetical protein
MFNNGVQKLRGRKPPPPSNENKKHARDLPSPHKKFKISQSFTEKPHKINVREAHPSLIPSSLYPEKC